MVLAATICNKAGKAIVSRQFIEMSRSRIESLITAFPKLVFNVGSGDQHTFVEVDTVRYVYQPLDDSIYLVLITNKQSNILQDIDTLQLFSRAVADVCRVVDEREASRHAFQLISVFDEIVALGYKENVSLSQIRTIIQMESQEERIQAEIERNKIKEVRDEMRQKQKQFESMKKLESQRRAGGVDSYGSSYNSGSYKPVQSASSGVPLQSRPAEFGGMGNTSSPVNAGNHSPAPMSMNRGMQLGKKPGQGGSELAAALATEYAPAAVQKSTVPPVSVSDNNSLALLKSDKPVHLDIEEKCAFRISRDGGIQSFEVKGDLFLRALDPAKAALRLQLATDIDTAVQYKTHPNVDKQAFSSNQVIALKDAAQSFPVNQLLAVLKWRYSSQDESKLPLLLSCWPSPNPNNTCNVTIEFERPNSTVELQQVAITIPIPGNAPPSVLNVTGSFRVDPQTRSLVWLLDKVDGDNDSGTLEFVINAPSSDGLYPIHIAYVSNKLLCPLSVKACTLASGESVDFSTSVASTPEHFQVV